MAIQCPYCQYSITVKNAKPGKYTPKCPKCTKPFALRVPEASDAEWIVGPAAETAKPKPTFDSTEATGGFAAPASPPAPTRKVVAKQSFDETEATGGFQPPTQKSAAANTERTMAVPEKATDTNDQTAIGDFTQGNAGDDRTMASESEVKDDVEESRAGKMSNDELDMPDKLGGYEVVKELGRGGMGAVFLARQVSLDRPVALKVMNARWAKDPIFLARFTREAYAAAQLVHHNVVQIYDIGDEKGINFFSMEFVEGRSLGDLVKKEGKVEPTAAAGFILQAARGLKFAHDRGMIHRDVKPDNLMLNNQGIVKVADLGLVKTPSMTRADDAPPDEIEAQHNGSAKNTRTGLASLPADMTNAQTAMGSPAYMSPEQCRDAATVDHRADIYSLGCSLYMMLTGHTPFKGSTAFEVMTKHAAEPVVPVHQVEKSVPKELSAVINRMLEKEPAKRQKDMGELIRDLEKWIGVRGGSNQPTEENLATLEECVGRFNGSSSAKIRSKLTQGFILASLVGTVAGFFVSAAIGVGVLSMLLHAALAYFVVSGIASRSYLFRKTREVVFGSPITDWLTALFSMAMLLLILFLTGLIWAWLGFAVLGVLLALGMQFLIDRQVNGQRQGPVTDCENMFKRMRLNGCDEETLRAFVASNSGRHWEEFFEALFGYEAKLSARTALGTEAAQKSRYAAWRDPLVRKLERVQLTRKEARERKLLQKLEAKKLQAEGMDRQEAEEQAEAAAAQLVEQAAEIKAAEVQAAPVNRTMADASDETVAPQRPVNIRAMLSEAEKPPKRLPKPPAQPLKHLVKFIFGWKLRFVLGALLIALSVLWVKQNIDHMGKQVEELKQGVSAADAKNMEGAKKEAQKFANILKALVDSESKWRPLELSFAPAALTDLIDHVNPFVAGLLLVVSVFFGSTLTTLLCLAGAFVCFAGHRLGIPEVGPLKPFQLSLIGGTLIAIVGIVLGWRRKE